MPRLTWQPEMALNLAPMDTTHQEFVDLLGAADAALALDEPTLLRHWQALVAHTVDHFAQEDRWMADTGFAPGNCHAAQHQAVLDVMQECARRAAADADFEPLRLAVVELASWFVQHAQTMDAALAQHLGFVGYDTNSRQCTTPLSPAAPAITGCASASCG